VATNVGNIFLPQTPETFGYDADGNLTNSGRWTVTWDAENRALSFASLASAPLASQKKVDCAYDFQGRRIQKIVSTNSGSVWIPVYTNRHVYDGWNLVAILNPQSSILQSFTWGTDLSGSSQGAGGVGGLLSMTVYGSTNAGSYFYAFDGNGNVSALVNAANGIMVAQYEYGPFGEVIRATGPMAKANPIRFSTKFSDDETGLCYYGYRYYDPSTGRWPNRDPIGEKGGKNIYAFVGNDPIFYVDVLGWGRWNIQIIPSGSFWSVPVITASYFATADDLKKVCCGQTYHMTREAWTFGGIVGTPNDDGGDGGGTVYTPAPSNPDQPGPPIGLNGNGPAIIPRTIHFIWHAICDCNGKELSRTERYYSVWWNGGSWTSPPFQPPQPPNFPFYPYPGAGPL